MTEQYTISIEQFAMNLDFILTRFEHQDSLWPRKISTKVTDNRQILVYSKQEALARFRQSNFVDCRINAYPDYTEYKGINRQAPNFIFAELDRPTFKSDRALKLAYNKTVENFSNMLGSSPTIIASGSGGAHFYQPVEAFVLEQEQFFLSRSANGSINSKNGKQVKILQRWNLNRPKINPLLYEFSRWLIYNRVNNRGVKTTATSAAAIEEDNNSSTTSIARNNNSNKKIDWIESLLQHPILSDDRKYCLWRIFAPYLINVKKLSDYNSASDIMVDWLNKCDQVERLNFNPKTKVREILARVGDYYPIGLQKLMQDNRRLYDIVISSL